ncbi:PAS domain S-box protein [Leptospira fainei serovar Hurstbridge str. BUT 6]|uniref:histidine kinase n=1 Tax=Leptospira fainei serovar Hurstbridge str. BUT 6 TaxID=1193011 RepID=S3VYT4_9LEPT|nr:PAS domain S-box protein [Leptospira fainei]EPG73272.1 PAS domain S-box protein [Leptospira fainei serovar Hurstbridge str. BUT 6]
MPNCAMADPNLDFFKYLIEEGRELVCLHSADGTYLYVSPSIKTIAGYEPEELIGKKPNDFFHYEDQEYIKTTGQISSLQGSENNMTEHRFLRKDGNFVWLQTLTRPIRNSKGEVFQLHTTSRDLSQEISIRKKLKKSEELLQEACKLSLMGAWELDLTTMISEWSHYAHELLEISHNNMMSFDDSLRFYPEEIRTIIQKSVFESAKSGESWDIKVPARTGKNKPIWIRIIGKPQSADGKTEKIRGVFQDVTKEVETEEKNKTLINQLTRQNHQLEEFNRIISHNLRSPVGNLPILVDLLRESSNQEETNKYLHMLQELSTKMMGILDDLVDVVKVQQAKDLKPEKIIFDKILDSVSAGFLPEIQKRKAVISADFSKLISFRYNKAYMESIFSNLLSNSLKYSIDAVPPEIKIETSVSAGKHFLTWSDNGCGIDMKRNGAKIFQLHKTFHPNVRGKGLGLFMVKSQIESMGGDIEVQSIPGEGTKFTICFNKHTDN